MLYAVAIEEIDAWVLTIYSNKMTHTSATPKEQLERILNHPFSIKKEKNETTFDFYLRLTEPFTWKKCRKGKNNLEKAKTMNNSLSQFIEEFDHCVL